MTESILIVDDDEQIRKMLRASLVAAGFQVGDAKTGQEALDRVRFGKYDLVLLDIALPDVTGLEVCRSVRAKSDLPIIVLTVRSSEPDRVEAFSSGADDFVSKPFSMPELLARIRATLRRKGRPASLRNLRLQLGDAEIDFETREVRARDRSIRLTPKEFDLLLYLAERPNKVVSHRELLRKIWGLDSGLEKGYLHVFINRLRKKLEACPKKPKYLITEPWVGYRLSLPERNST